VLPSQVKVPAVRVEDGGRGEHAIVGACVCVRVCVWVCLCAGVCGGGGSISGCDGEQIVVVNVCERCL